MLEKRETKSSNLGKVIKHNKGTVKIVEYLGSNGVVSEFLAECSQCSRDIELWLLRVQ